MFQILKKRQLNEEDFEFTFLAPDIARKALPGQFVMLRIDETGERFPLTIADFDKDSVTVIFHTIGRSTKDLSKLNVGDSIRDLVGPLGNPTDMKDSEGVPMSGKTVCLVGGGLGIACLYPIAREFKKKNHVILIAGARTASLLLWIERFKDVCDEVIICTDDGSSGKKGFVTDALKDLLDKRALEHQKIDLVITVGPPIMMKFVSRVTKDRVKTMASLNPIMVDGTGMCGGCRVLVGNQVRFACVDGPEFDAHLVDFDDLMNRNSAYKKEEEHACRCG